ncbi:MAG: Ig-like domain-containing protein [Candidatus Paceibacterota bacterium]
MSIVDRLKESWQTLKEKVESNRPLAAILTIAGVLIIGFIVCMALGLLPVWMTASPSIETSKDSLEVGQTTLLTAKTPFSPDIYHFEWILSNPNVGTITSEGKQATFTAKEPGKTTVTFKVDGKAVNKEITVFSKAYLDATLPESWVYIGNAYDYNLYYPGDSVKISEVYVENAYNQRLPDEKFFETIQGQKKLLIANDVDPGNYIFVAKGLAESDGRTLKSSSPFSALTEILKGYYHFSIANENLIGIEPWHYSAIETFMKNEFGVDANLNNVKLHGKTAEIASFNSKYVFYRDPTRGDKLCYEMDVTAKGDQKDIKTFSKLTTRANDGTSWTVATDGIIFLAFPEGTSYYMNSLEQTFKTTQTSQPNPTNQPNPVPTNNNPSYGQTNIPSPPPPI